MESWAVQINTQTALREHPPLYTGPGISQYFYGEQSLILQRNFFLDSDPLVVLKIGQNS